MPKRIVLVRHGCSEGNADSTLYRTVPDNKINLTAEPTPYFLQKYGADRIDVEKLRNGQPRCGDIGIEQAKHAGIRFKEIAGDGPVYIYHSPFDRTTQTMEYMKEACCDQVRHQWPDPRLREQVSHSSRGDVSG